MAEDDLIVKRVPQAPEVERSLIGSLLIDCNEMSDIINYISPEDFYIKKYKTIYKAMLRLFERKIPFDVVIVKDELEKEELPDDLTTTLLKQIIIETTSSVNAKRYAEIIREKSLLRKLIEDCQNIQNECYEGKKSVSDILENAEKMMFSLIQNKRVSKLTSIRDVLISVIDKIEENACSDSHITGVTTGFVDLDNRTSGLQRSDLILIAARPAMGKTAFALNLALSAAKKGTATAIFSLEMSSEQLGTRLLSMESDVKTNKMRSGDISHNDWSKIVYASEQLIKAPILLDDKGSINISELRSKCRRAKIEYNLGMIVIDYLQLMSGSGRESRTQEIAEISRGLKMLAKELDVPVVALSQLSRAPEARADHRPILSDLRESGSIEQDADIVIFLYRDEYYNPETEEKGVAEVIIAKQRQGSTGTIKLSWNSEKTKFGNLEQYNE